MIHKELEENKELKLAILSLNQNIKDIKLENIISIEDGSRSYCYIVKNTNKGDVFIKIDDDLEYFNNEYYSKNEILKKQTIINNFQQSFVSYLKKVGGGY